jgi:hypothetical protein
MSPAGGHLGFSIGPKSNNIWLAACNDQIFNSILHVVSEKKIFEISANQKLLWPLAAILDNRSEQKVTTIDQNCVRNISAKYGSNPSSSS